MCLSWVPPTSVISYYMEKPVIFAFVLLQHHDFFNSLTAQILNDLTCTCLLYHTVHAWYKPNRAGYHTNIYTYIYIWHCSSIYMLSLVVDWHRLSMIAIKLCTSVCFHDNLRNICSYACHSSIILLYETSTINWNLHDDMVVDERLHLHSWRWQNMWGYLWLHKYCPLKRKLSIAICQI